MQKRFHDGFLVYSYQFANLQLCHKNPASSVTWWMRQKLSESHFGGSDLPVLTLHKSPYFQVISVHNWVLKSVSLVSINNPLISRRKSIKLYFRNDLQTKVTIRLEIVCGRADLFAVIETEISWNDENNSTQRCRRPLCSSGETPPAFCLSET